ncbi:hypothetical protein E4T44_03937 [Aureobasidium sp. EXF-8845]|nr:hypothetical protein E4T44_03937 [Aureobasidium sp. EXF-8845]KAI4854626.1 hypothetical protein E4T45_03914 [Aureobasidium sp. EXF-8846]
MLRNRPSRVSLGMADVNQTKQRLKLKQASHPLVAETDWAYIHHQQPHQTRPQPQPHYNLGEGAQRSRDASLVQVDSNRHVSQFAIYESTDSVEDSDSDEPASPTVEPVARLVHIAEVSPTITQVSGYNPPALVNLPPERGSVQEEPRPGANRGHHHHLSNPHPPSASRYGHGFEPNLIPRPGYSYRTSRQLPNHSNQRDLESRTNNISRRGHNPNAVSFAPRVHLGSPFQELDPQRRANIASVYQQGGTLRARPSTFRGATITRGTMNYQTRPRPMPRPRGSLMPTRPSNRASSRAGGYLRPPAASSIDMVMDRYPVFPSMMSQSDPSRLDNTSFPRPESIPQRRGILTPPGELRITHAYPRSRLSSATDSYKSTSSRASNKSCSSAAMLSALGEGSGHDIVGSGSWDRGNMGSVRSSRAGSGTSILTGSSGRPSNRIPPPQSPLDLLTQELRRLSAGLSARSQSSSGCTSGITSTDGRLLSGNVFYSDSDDEFDEREVKTWSHPSPRSPSRMDKCDIKGREGNLASQPQRHPGMVARIVDMETDCQIGTTKLISTSSSTQSGSSNLVVNTSVTDSSTPGDLPSLPPATPGHQLVRATRHSYTPGSGLRSQAMRVYDDEQPASTQPQTPADLRRRFNPPVGPEMLITCQTARTTTRMSAMESSRLGSPRNTHRNTYPSFQQASPQPHATSSQPSSPYSPNLDLRTAAAITAVQRRRTARGVSNENAIDPSMNGMEAERDALLRRIEADGTTTMDDTPPREGRYERYIS